MAEVVLPANVEGRVLLVDDESDVLDFGKRYFSKSSRQRRQLRLLKRPFFDFQLGRHQMKAEFDVGGGGDDRSGLSSKSRLRFELLLLLLWRKIHQVVDGKKNWRAFSCRIQLRRDVVILAGRSCTELFVRRFRRC